MGSRPGISIPSSCLSCPLLPSQIKSCLSQPLLLPVSLTGSPDALSESSLLSRLLVFPKVSAAPFRVTPSRGLSALTGCTAPSGTDGPVLGSALCLCHRHSFSCATWRQEKEVGAASGRFPALLGHQTAHSRILTLDRKREVSQTVFKDLPCAPSDLLTPYSDPVRAA